MTKSLAILYTLLLLCTRTYQGAKVVRTCLQPGDDFHSGICLATSDHTWIYWKYNGEAITTDSRALELGLFTSQSYNEDGHIFQIVTLRNVYSPVNLSCYEGLEELIFYFIEICAPSFDTGMLDVTDFPENLTNTTTGQHSSDQITIGVVSAVAVAIVILTVGLMIIIWCVYRRLRQPRNGAETPPSDRICEDNPSGENDDNVDRGNGARGACPTEPQSPVPAIPNDTTEAVLARDRRSLIRDQPKTRATRDDSTNDIKVVSGPESDVKLHLENCGSEDSNNNDSQMSSGSQCTDDGGLGSVFCFLNKNKVHITMNKCPSFGRMTYCMDPRAKEMKN